MADELQQVKGHLSKPMENTDFMQPVTKLVNMVTKAGEGGTVTKEMVTAAKDTSNVLSDIPQD